MIKTAGWGVSWRRWRTPKRDRDNPRPSLLVLVREEEKVLKQVVMRGS
jgi:hypothetical protein